MINKRINIIQSAISLFSKKGYYSTSVQEIAEHCGISKGTLYNFFESKEELLIEVIELSHEKMLQNAVNVDLELSLSKKERLIKKIVVQYYGFLDNKVFITMLMRTTIPQKNPRIPQLIKKVRMTMLNWYKDCLIEAYGHKVKPYIWDLAVMFQGVIREYITLLLYENKQTDFHKVARFVVERFESMVEHTNLSEPILTSNDMTEYEAFDTEMEPASIDNQIDYYLDEVYRMVQISSISGQEEHEAIAAVECLKEAFDEHQPKYFLIKSLLLYLGEIKECQTAVSNIEQVLRYKSFD